MVSVEDAVREAIATDEGPVVLGDLADSGGAGTPGDGTAILAELLKQNARGAVIGNIADPDAVQERDCGGSRQAGDPYRRRQGRQVPRRAGRRLAAACALSRTEPSPPSTRFNAGTYHRGPTVVIDCGGTEVILTARPVLVFEANHFRSLGIEPAERKILVCKAELQHRAGIGRCRPQVYRRRRAGAGDPGFEPAAVFKIRRPVFPLDDI